MSHPFANFAMDQFNEEVMAERLPKPVYLVYQAAIHRQQAIDPQTADAIAHAMKTWAMERGATHFSHWFQPLNGRTAEKHVAFIQPNAQGQPITRLSGKALMKGETDGSSFPHGGLRDTFEARGYTFWDTNSYAFVRGHVLYIPSVFMSYRGDTLDLKLPLIKACQALSDQACRLLHAIGRTEVSAVQAMLGLEQEFFLVDKEKADARPDLKYLGRTLFSRELPQSGKYQDTYFRGMHDRVQKYMDEVNAICWSLGIYANVEHNEFSPGQYEFSSAYADAINTVDQNMIVMDVLEQVAPRHGFRCLLHEKPFAGMNGSGKHNNLSLLTSDGDNLFDPGDMQPEDLQFVLFLTAFIVAVDRHQSLLVLAASDEGNDHRLGGSEAPPNILSINLGQDLHRLFSELAKTTEIPPIQLTSMIQPLVSLSDLAIENTDRNRTSPISFTGNKFELRMLGSSMNASALNTFLYTAMAEVLAEMADRIEKRNPKDDLHALVMTICHEYLKDHARILFDGDGYTLGWQEEARRRGLSIEQSYIDSVNAMISPQTIALCKKFDILSQAELRARREILMRQYAHSLEIQAKVLVHMADQDLLPGLYHYQELLDRLNRSGLSKSIARKVKENAQRLDQVDGEVRTLRSLLEEVLAISDLHSRCLAEKDQLRPEMEAFIRLLNAIEEGIPAEFLPYPSLDQLVIQ